MLLNNKRFRTRGFSIALAAAICPVPDAGVIDTVLAKRGKEVTVKFFASWCGSCLQELSNLSGKSRDDSLLLLSTFDSPEAAGATLKHFKITQDCLAGDTLARRLGVTHLPRTFVYSNGKFRPKDNL